MGLLKNAWCTHLMLTIVKNTFQFQDAVFIGFPFLIKFWVNLMVQVEASECWSYPSLGIFLSLVDIPRLGKGSIFIWAHFIFLQLLTRVSFLELPGLTETPQTTWGESNNHIYHVESILEVSALWQILQCQRNLESSKTNLSAVDSLLAAPPLVLLASVRAAIWYFSVWSSLSMSSLTKRCRSPSRFKSPIWSLPKPSHYTWIKLSNVEAKLIDSLMLNVMK